jgi:DNA-binding response OmpR family regulator
MCTIGTSANRASSVLIADDDEDICALVAAILTRAGFHAETADGGRSVLDAANRTSVALYVLDVRMPDLSGLDVCRQLKRALDPSTPVLLISAESTLDDLAAGYAAGCDDYLPKPFSARELVRRVDQLLAKDVAS